MLDWISRFNICCFLDSHQYLLPGNTRECIAAAGSISCTHARYNFIKDTGTFVNSHSDWIFGHLAYDLKNEIEEGFQSSHPERIGFPDAFFFVPEYVLILDQTSVNIGSTHDDHGNVFEEILHVTRQNINRNNFQVLERLSREEYLSTIEKLKEHILRGDCYEINFCQEFYAQQAIIDPVAVYRDLSAISPNPFSAFYRNGERYVVCASPERFLKKTGRRIMSQPIKGTAPRDIENQNNDRRYGKELSTSEKDRSENVMIVDLVRNDLSKVCVEGSVKVDELFGVYAFPQVHQMISTVSGELREGVEFEDIIRASFPMGSMTGAPKKKVMELIERYECSRRGIFSGAIGYVDPEKDFDFNVVIRSIMYNNHEQYLSFLAGSGITFYSDPKKEYDECHWKASAIKKVLGAE